MRKLTVFCVILMLCLQVFSGTAVYGAETGNETTVVIDTSKYAPKLSTVSGNDIPTINAGEMQTVTYQIKNSSYYQAKDITVSLKMIDESKTPLVLENFDLRQSIDVLIKDQAEPVSFDIKILESAPEGLYAFKLIYQYQSLFDNNFETFETVYIRVQNTNIKPTLAVDNIAVKPDASNVSTEAVKLELTIKNIGTLAAKDIKVTLGGLKSGGFTTHNSSNIQYISRIAGSSSGVASYQLLMPSGSAAGSNELTVKMEYKDDAGAEYTMDNQIFVPAGENGDAKPSISFDKIVSPQSALAAGENFEIKLDLKNGGAAARNIKVSLTTGGEIITKSMNPVYIDKLDSKAVQNVVFKLFSADEAVTKNYPVAINIEYEDIFGTKYNASQYVGVFIENNSGKTVPRIIVDKYSIEPSSVRAAEDFKLKLSFLNTSKTVNVTNIKVTVASDDGTFTPTDTGNTFYLEGIPAQESVERELMLHVKPDAEQKSYALTVNFEYEDEKGNPFTTKEIVSVRVLQNPRLVTGELSLPPETYVGQPLSLYIDFYNMGKSTLYNMLVKAVGDFDGQNLSYYVGNFESGRTDSFDVSVIPSKPGKLTGNVIFSFEDANGKVTEIPKEFTVNVMEMQQQGAMLDENGIPIDKAAINGQMPEGMKGKKTSILLYIIPAVFLAALIVFFIVFRKRRARRKEMSLDE